MLYAFPQQRSELGPLCSNFPQLDKILVKKLVEGLLRYWPFANSPKEVMFLTELLEVLEVCEISRLDANIVTKLFKRLIKCISGAQLQVFPLA